MTPVRYRFAADATLGRLARHLRLLGFDTVYQEGPDATGFFGRVDIDRIALTRVRALCGCLPQTHWLYLGDNDPHRQVGWVLAAFSLRSEDLDPFSRCTRCNLPVVQLDPTELAGRVPIYVWQTQTRFSGCDGCGGVFWPGSHTQRYRKRIQTWLQGEAPTA